MTFTVDAYEGWSEDQLKERCQTLCQSVGRYELMIAMMVEASPESLRGLPQDWQAKARNLNEAYKD